MIHWLSKLSGARLLVRLIQSAGGRALALRLLTVLALAAPAAAHAQVSCNVNSTPTAAFGTVNLLSGGPYWASTTAPFVCNGTSVPSTVYFCLSVGAGNGYLTTTTNRTISFSTSKAQIAIYQTGAGGTQIGNGTSYPMAGPFTLSVGVYAQATYNMPTAVELLTPQTSAPGSYSANFSGGDYGFYYTTSSVASCTALMSGSHNSTNGDLVISATVPASCAVTATSLAFGSVANLSSSVAAQATVSVTCNGSTPVTVALDNGSTGTSPTARKMVVGGQSITYGIYQNSGHTTAWGTSSAAVSTTANTTPVNITAYGLVPIQTTPPPGTYADVVNVTVSY